MTNETHHPSRRAALGFLSQAIMLTGVAASTTASAAMFAESEVPGSEDLEQLKQRLAAAPRRRTFGRVPFVVTSRDQWDHEAAEAVLAYRNRALQVWECTDIGAPWLNLMREAINAQVFAHGNMGFLAVAAVHGSAHLTLFDQIAWDTHSLFTLSNGKAARNTFVTPKSGTSPSDDLQNISGYYGPENNNIRTLQERGAVFIACHDSIYATANAVQQRLGGSGPSTDVIAADLTNHLVPGAVLVPSVVAFLVELQRVGFTYSKGD